MIEQIDNLIDKVNNQKLICQSHVDHFYDCLDEDDYKLWEMINPRIIESGLDIDQHRWYEVSTTVFDCNGILIGVRGVSKLYSESMTYGDCYVQLEMFEMEPVTKITYTKLLKTKDES